MAWYWWVLIVGGVVVVGMGAFLALGYRVLKDVESDSVIPVRVQRVRQPRAGEDIIES